MNKLFNVRLNLAVLLIGLLAFVMVLGGVVPSAQAAAPDLRVTKTDDTDDGVCDSDCSLREAISVALPGDVIKIRNGTYTLTLGMEILIDQFLTLEGSKASSTIIQASTVDPVLLPNDPGVADFRVFYIAGGDVEMSDLTIRHGNTTTGAGIWNQGTLTLTDSTVTNNRATRRMGGIRNQGTLTLAGSTVSNNAALQHAGGIFNTGTLSITGGTVTGNTSGDGGGGIDNDGALVISDSSVTDNTSSRWGGGINNNGSGVATITNTAISGNTAGRQGGGINNNGDLTLNQSPVSNNTAGESGGGLNQWGDGFLAKPRWMPISC